MKRLFFILLFFITSLLYVKTGERIENRTEAEDAYEYVMMVEHGAEHHWYYHQHHLLYGTLVTGFDFFLEGLGLHLETIQMMRLLSALCASGSLFFFAFFCYKRYSLRPFSSLLATLFLASCYGFWRYAAEAEIPLVASFFVLAALYFSTDIRKKRASFYLGIIFSVISVLIHIMNAVAVFAAIPCFYWLAHQKKRAVSHLLLSALGITLVYLWIGASHEVYAAENQIGFNFSFGAFIKAIVAFCQCIISCDFMMGFKSIRVFLAELFAHRMLLEEFYYGERLSRAHILISTSTFMLVFVGFLGALIRAIWVWFNRLTHRQRLYLPEGKAALFVAFIFFVGYAGLLLIVEPGNPELWIMGLIPFALLFCGWILLPLTSDNRLWIPFLMIIFLNFHNGKAIDLLGDLSKDYQYQKAKPLLEMVKEKDVIVSAGNPVFERYLRYHTKAEVWYLYHMKADELSIRMFEDVEGGIYVCGDVLSPPKSLVVRFSEKSKAITSFATQIRASLVPHRVDEFGGIYKWVR